MNFYLKREHLANSYFLSILARVSKGLNPHQTVGVESLNTQIFKELGISYNQFLSIKNRIESNNLIDKTSPDYAFIEGIENLVESGVAFYLDKHGHEIQALNAEHGLQTAVEALKDEFEGESGDTMEVSDNGDTNSGVIQAILDDLKNRQADEVGRTVNLILKLNADKQRELLDEQQANSEEIDETMNETGLDGQDTEEELNEGENPLEEGAQDIDNQEGDDASFEDDPFAEESSDKKEDGKGSAEDDAPTLEDKKKNKKSGDSGNPFEGFESMVLNGRSPLDQAGTEAIDGPSGTIAGATFGVGWSSFIDAAIVSLNDNMSPFAFMKGLVTSTGTNLVNYLKENYKGVGLDILKQFALSKIASAIANFRLEKDLRTSYDDLAKGQGANKGKLHMTPEQFKKAYKSYDAELHKILNEVPSIIKKSKVLQDIEKMVQEKYPEYKMYLQAPSDTDASHADICAIFDMSLLFQIQKDKEFSKYFTQLEAEYKKILDHIDAGMTKLKEKRQDFIPFISIMNNKKSYIVTFGFTSNVIVSQAFTESEFRDVLEGMAETLGEDNPSIAFRFMNEINTQVGNEDEIGRIDSLYSEGVEVQFGTTFDLLSFTFRLAMKKLKKYKLGENLLRKTLTIPLDDYNKELKEMESIIKANAKYLEGALRAKSKFLTWCLDVGAIKVLDKPQFVDGLAIVVAIDTINPIEVDKQNQKLTYKSESVDLSHVGVSKYKLMPFKNLGAVLVKACEDVNKTISDVLSQRLDGYQTYGGINPIEGKNSDSGWVVVAHNVKQPKETATESQISIMEEVTNRTDAIFYDKNLGFAPGTEGIVNAFKNKWNSMSVIKSPIEMTTAEYQSLANEFKAYGKECLETLKIDIKNDPSIGLLGLQSYLNSTFEVKQDSHKRPMVLIYKTEKGLVPVSHWKKYDQNVNIQTQNSKVDQLINVIKNSIESYIAETKFKGMDIFPVIAKDLTEAYAVIANPIEIKVEAKVESLDLFDEFQPITAGFEQPMYGTESHLEMKENYKTYNKILNILKVGSTIANKLKEKAQLDYVFGDRSYQACVESFITNPNLLIDRLKYNDGYIQVPLFTLDPSNTSTLYRNEFLQEANESLDKILPSISIESSRYNLINVYNPNGSKPLDYGYIEIGCYDDSCESLSGKELLSQLADNYLAKDYHDDLVLENKLMDNGRYGLVGLESEGLTQFAEHPFKTMTTAYHHLTRNGMSKLKAEFYMNNLYGTATAGIESLASSLCIDESDAAVITRRSKYLTMEYLKGATESALNNYSAENIYDTIKGYMQKSLDINGVDGIAYEPKLGLLIGLESSDNIKLLAKSAITLQKKNPLPEYMFINAISSRDGKSKMNIISVPLNLGTESLRDIPQILKAMKSSLKELEFYNSLNDVGDISMKNIFGFVTKPLAGTGNQLQKHIKNIMLAARGETLKHAYTQYGVESYEFKDIQREFEKSTSNVFTAYVTSICLASRLGMNINLPALYQNLNNN